ncbi:MAG: NAD(+)/NADH kinase [Armatimonadota bacterium]|nr:NAD(+)/NADH kinase [Armatimonadota bacterium]
MQTVGLAPNPKKREALELAAEVLQWIESRGARVVVMDEAARKLGRDELAAADSDVAAADVLLVLGGDGTVLRWSQLAARSGTPMLGVNFGQYGFITEIHPRDTIKALERIFDGDYIISNRSLLMARVIAKDGECKGEYTGLNDAVVSKGPVARMLGLRMFVNGKYIVTYSADGIIVSTPTGSTAYSLSAGGPVVHPSVPVFVVTPICPHTMNARSLVVPDTEVINITGEAGEDDQELVLTLDGQVAHQLAPGDTVEITKASIQAKLIQLDPLSFYHKLQQRLRWGERFSGERPC